MPDYSSRLPARRPPGLRLTTFRRPWFRLDSQEPGKWGWKPFRAPRYRFDSASGCFRVRYAAADALTALRERFDDEGRIVSVNHAGLRLVELAGPVRALDLRNDGNLAALGLDKQICTSRAPDVWRACQHLADLLHGWYGEQLGGLVFRSRTQPQRSANLALFRHCGLATVDHGPLMEQDELLATGVLSDSFVVEDW